MKETITIQDIDVILESLKNTKHIFENHQDYPSYEFKQKRITEVDDVASKLRSLKKIANTHL